MHTQYANIIVQFECLCVDQLLMRSQEANIIAQFGYFLGNHPAQQVMQVQQKNMKVQVNYVLITFKGNTNTGYNKGIQIYLQ